MLPSFRIVSAPWKVIVDKEYVKRMGHSDISLKDLYKIRMEVDPSTMFVLWLAYELHQVDAAVCGVIDREGGYHPEGIPYCRIRGSISKLVFTGTAILDELAVSGNIDLLRSLYLVLYRLYTDPRYVRLLNVAK